MFNRNIWLLLGNIYRDDIFEIKNRIFLLQSKLLKNVEEIDEIYKCIDNIKWKEKFLLIDGKVYMHQTAYNKALKMNY